MKRNTLLFTVPLIVVVIVLGIFGLWFGARAQERPPSAKDAQTQTLGQFMKKKFDLSQGLLAGLSTNDLESVDEDAQHLSLLCLDEDWNIIKTPEYVERSTEFRRTANAIAKAARVHNLAAAQLSYVQLVGQCFSCHEFVRDLRKAK